MEISSSIRDFVAAQDRRLENRFLDAIREGRAVDERRRLFRSRNDYSVIWSHTPIRYSRFAHSMQWYLVNLCRRNRRSWNSFSERQKERLLDQARRFAYRSGERPGF